MRGSIILGTIILFRVFFPEILGVSEGKVGKADFDPVDILSQCNLSRLPVFWSRLPR